MLYIHIPYCHHKCTYCGFYSVAGRHNRDEYVDALCRELEIRRVAEPLQTVYIGGGTPSLLSADQLRRIVRTIRDNYDVSSVEEVTIEANPEDLTEAYLVMLADLHFFARLSIGIQSFDDAELRILNRVHNSKQAVDAVCSAARAGFGNVSVDLIMGLPSQTERQWLSNLDTLSSLLDLNVVKHLSCYELTVEPGSILERQLKMGRLSLPDEAVVEKEYGILYEWCERNGFEQYEVSNFSLPGFRSRHNSRYWNRTPYIGVGAAAHSFDGKRRMWNVADVAEYVAKIAKGVLPYDEETLTERDAYNEYLMTSLRTVDGIEKERVPESFKEQLSKSIVPYVEYGLLVETATAYRPTRRGLMQADGIAADLFIRR